MGPFLMRFHIRDLERFTGVKAHTIRVWERRYGLLQPERTDTNIRTYDIAELKTILNVAYLNRQGVKISRIAAMRSEERDRAVRDAALAEEAPEGLLNTLVLAMLGFDEAMFTRACDEHQQRHGFRSLAEDVLARLMERIGILWQSSAICPAHEHFASNLVRQRIIVATAALPAPTGDGRLNVLFLPDEEIHELGLLYLDHVLRARAERTVYLGQSVPADDLKQIASLHVGELRFISLMVVKPSPDEAAAYLQRLRAQLPESRISFVLGGAPLRALTPEQLPDGMAALPDLRAMVGALDAPG